LEIGIALIVNSLLLGVGLTMDAFSVSLANGLAEPRMRLPRMCAIAGVYAVFQALMPLLGWLFVHSVAETFAWFRPLIPWIALALLLFLGVRMLREGFEKRRGGDETQTLPKLLTVPVLLLQGVATSIDALSVGFTIADYRTDAALLAAGIIAAVTFCFCLAGLALGKRIGTRLAGRADMLGGLILIAIGLEIWFRGVFL